MEFNNLSEEEKGYLFGMFEGDGYKIHDKKSRHYQIEFYLNSEKDKEIIKFIVEILKKIKLKPNLYQDKRCNCKRIRVYCKELFGFLEKKISLSDKTKEFNLGFVSGLIDSEGHVDKKKSYILIINTNKDILDKCEKFLREIEIGVSISKRKKSAKDKLESYRMYISVKFKNHSNLSIKTKRL